MYQSEEGKIFVFFLSLFVLLVVRLTRQPMMMTTGQGRKHGRSVSRWPGQPASLLLRGIREIGAALEFGGKSVQALWVLSLSLSLCAGGPCTVNRPTRYRGPGRRLQVDMAVCLLCSEAARGKGFLWYTRRVCGMVVVGGGRCWCRRLE